MNGPTSEEDRILIRRRAATPERVQQREQAGKYAGRDNRKI